MFWLFYSRVAYKLSESNRSWPDRRTMRCEQVRSALVGTDGGMKLLGVLVSPQGDRAKLGLL